MENNRFELTKDWGLWLSEVSDWKSFYTLTFDQSDRHHPVTRTEAEYKFRRLIQSLNTDLFGNHYTRIVGHSYFGYALAIEKHKSGLLHMHALIDEPTNWTLAISIWNKIAGYLKIVPVENKEGACRYVSKYVAKDGEVLIHLPKKRKSPSFRPMWYLAGR